MSPAGGVPSLWLQVRTQPAPGPQGGCLEVSFGLVTKSCEEQNPHPLKKPSVIPSGTFLFFS